MKFIKHWEIQIALILLLVSCGEGLNIREDSGDDNIDQGICLQVTETYTSDRIDLTTVEANFANVRTHVFDRHCASCHYGQDATAPRLDDYEQTSLYLTPGQSDQSELYLSLDNGSMPPGVDFNIHRQELVEFVARWIDEGAVN